MHNILRLRYVHICILRHRFIIIVVAISFSIIMTSTAANHRRETHRAGIIHGLALCWSGTCTRVHMRVYGTNLIASRVRFPYECGGGNGVVLLLCWTSRTARAQQSRIIHDNITIVKHITRPGDICVFRFFFLIDIYRGRTGERRNTALINPYVN